MNKSNRDKVLSAMPNADIKHGPATPGDKNPSDYIYYVIDDKSAKNPMVLGISNKEHDAWRYAKRYLNKKGHHL